jgi:dihydroxyacetone kinase
MCVEEFAAALREAASSMERHRDELCRLDSGVGDGDHGVTVARGFRAAAEAATRATAETGVQSAPEAAAPAGGAPLNFSTFFAAAGAAMEEAMGGAMGPLYGAFFAGAASASDAKPVLSVPELAGVMAAAVLALRIAGEVEEGQKTVLDAMAPWARELASAADSGAQAAAAARRAADAAAAGASSTSGMRAVKGRARYRGGRSVGFIDAGASSFSLFAKALADALASHGEEESEGQP